MVDFYGFHVGKSASPMDGMGKASPTFTPQSDSGIPHSNCFCCLVGESFLGIFQQVVLEKNRTDLEKPFPEDPCMVYLPTFTIKKQPNVGKYISPMDPMGLNKAKHLTKVSSLLVTNGCFQK